MLSKNTRCRIYCKKSMTCNCCIVLYSYHEKLVLSVSKLAGTSSWFRTAVSVISSLLRGRSCNKNGWFSTIGYTEWRCRSVRVCRRVRRSVGRPRAAVTSRPTAAGNEQPHKTKCQHRRDPTNLLKCQINCELLRHLWNIPLELSFTFSQFSFTC